MRQLSLFGQTGLEKMVQTFTELHVPYDEVNGLVSLANDRSQSVIDFNGTVITVEDRGCGDVQTGRVEFYFDETGLFVEYAIF